MSFWHGVSGEVSGEVSGDVSGELININFLIELARFDSVLLPTHFNRLDEASPHLYFYSGSGGPKFVVLIGGSYLYLYFRGMGKNSVRKTGDGQ